MGGMLYDCLEELTYQDWVGTHTHCRFTSILFPLGRQSMEKLWAEEQPYFCCGSWSTGLPCRWNEQEVLTYRQHQISLQAERAAETGPEWNLII